MSYWNHPPAFWCVLHGEKLKLYTSVLLVCSAYEGKFPRTSNLSTIPLRKPWLLPSASAEALALFSLGCHSTLTAPNPRNSLVPLTHKEQCRATVSSQDLMLQVAAACLVVSYVPSPTVFKYFKKQAGDVLFCFISYRNLFPEHTVKCPPPTNQSYLLYK